MEKVLIVSGDGNLIDKLRFVFFENYGAVDVTSISNPDNCITVALKINPQLIVVDTSAFTGSMQSFFNEKNSDTNTRKIPVVFFDKGLKVNDIPQINSIINASLSDQDLGRSLTVLHGLKQRFDTFHKNEIVDENKDSFNVYEYMSDNQAYILNEVKRDHESERFQFDIVSKSPLFDSITDINSIKNQSDNSLEYLHGVHFDTKSFNRLPLGERVLRTQQFFDSNQRYLDIISIGISDTKIATFVTDITSQKPHQLGKTIVDEDNNYDTFINSFIANISHEFRTPMNAIIGFSRLLESETLEMNKKKQYVSIIQKSGFQLIETLDKLIDLSKIQSKQFSLHVNQFEFIKVLGELESFAKRKLFENNKEDVVSFSIKQANELHSLIVKSDQTRLCKF